MGGRGRELGLFRGGSQGVAWAYGKGSCWARPMGIETRRQLRPAEGLPGVGLSKRRSPVTRAARWRGALPEGLGPDLAERPGSPQRSDPPRIPVLSWLSESPGKPEAGPPKFA